MFSPGRLTLARQRRKLTKKSLADALGLDQKTIIRYEAGEVSPPDNTLSALAKFLQFPTEFFIGPDIDEPQPDAASFRSLSTMPARDRDAALAAGSLAFVLSDWVADRFTLPEQDLLEFKEGTEPESAARSLRQKWSVGERPIRHMIRLLEAKGVRVFSLVENTQSVDAFSLWRRDIPYIFLNTTKTAERSRFDSAHELGHLALHKHGGPQGREAEDQANQFASAFLMPEAQVKAKLPRVHSLNQLVEAKKYWGVSVAALNYRLHKLGITSEWQYRTFCIQITEHFGQSEPHGLERERSSIWEKVFQAMRAEGMTKQRIAASLTLPVAELESLVFGLANMQTIDGHGPGGAKSRASLKLVG
jgi:Zn-dependent peptidase ImmA (M78 family)/DNA-binding XRE family transcriptional regulator